METKLKQTLMAMMLLFAFVSARAGFIPVISTTPSCHGNDGTVSITGTGIPGPYTMYVYGNGYWQFDSPVVATSIFTRLQPGTYSFYAGPIGSSAGVSGTISIGNADTLTFSIIQPVCPATQGSITANVTGGAGPYTYLWSNGSNAQSITGLTASTALSLTVTDGQGCLVSDSAYVTQQSPVHDSIVNSSSVCMPVLTVYPYGGVGPYTYLWSTGATAASIRGSGNTFYSVQVTDANGCTAYDYFNATATSLLFDSIATSVTYPGCNRGGSIKVAMYNGTAPFSYSWSNGGTADSIVGLSAGYYYVTVTDAHGCTGANQFYLSSNYSLYAYPYAYNPACHSSNGSIYMYTSGGSWPYSYTWSNSSSNNLQQDTGLAAGTYQYTVTDAGGCTVTGTVNLIAQGNFNVSITTTPAVCPASNGTMTATASGSTGPYTYLWDNGSTAQTQINLGAWTGLTVIVTDSGGCQASATDSVAGQSTVLDSISLIGAGCTAPLLVAHPYGGTAPYTLYWSNGSSADTIASQANTSYYVDIIDANGCSNTDYVNISGIGLQFNGYATQITYQGCNTMGSIKVVMATGTAPYSYSWSTGAHTDSIGGLTQGYYYVTVTDANGCSGQNYYYIYNTSQLALYVDTFNPVCHGSNGYIQLHVYSGTSPFTYAWSNNSGNNTSSDSLLTTGSYQYTVSDGGGCSVTGSANLVAYGNFGVQFSNTPAICPNPGSMTANVTGGTGGTYTYLWSNGSTAQTQSNLTGWVVLRVTVTDTAGCIATAIDSIYPVSPIHDYISYGGQPCTNPLLIAHPSGGTAPYTFMWNSGLTGDSISCTQYTSYSLYITDANGCTGYDNIYTGSLGLQFDSASTHAVYPGCSNSLGSIKVGIASGTAPYSYLWSNGATTDSVGALIQGNYYVTVTDANGCTGSTYFNLYNSSIPNVYPYTSYTNCGGSTGAISLYVYYGSTPYSYQWSNSSNHTSVDSALSAGSYQYTVTDATGCSVSGTAAVYGQGSFLSNLSTTRTSCVSSMPTGTATAIVTNGGTPPFTYLWNTYSQTGSSQFTTSSSTISGLAYQTYVSVSIIDSMGCSSTNYDSAVVLYDVTCYDHITGYAFLDQNGNCIKDAGDVGYQSVNVWAWSNSGNGYSGYYYTRTDSNGYYDLEVLPGAYTVEAYTYYYGNCIATVCSGSYLDTFQTGGQLSSGNNFGYTGSPSFDLGVHMGSDRSTPGTDKEYWVYYYNYGNTSASNAVLTFVHDDSLTLTSTTPAYTSYNAATHTITWNLGSVPNNWTWSMVTMHFNVPSTLSLGTSLHAHADISPVSGDCNPADNSEDITNTVSGSFDPNEKEVSPSGNLTASDTVLTYTIRFQNTGNAPATHIVIKDTLSQYVDPASVLAGASSHPYSFALSGNGILTFTFDPIYLPDSSNGRAASTGFVTYTVHTRSNIAIGDQVKNTAHIYFDINPAVVTNTTVSTRSNFHTGMHPVDNSSMAVTISPNPIHEQSLVRFENTTGEVIFTLSDVTGQKVFETTASQPGLTINGQAYATGMYLYTAKDAAGHVRTGKVSISH